MPRSRRPVDHERDRSLLFLRCHRVDEEPLAVGRHVIVPEWRIHSNPSLEERSGNANLEVRGLPYRNRHQPAIRSDIEKLRAIVTPLRHQSTRRRHLPPRPGARKGLCVHLGSSRLVGHIGNPPAIGRELTIPFIKAGGAYWCRLASFEGKDPKILVSSFRIGTGKENEASV